MAEAAMMVLAPYLERQESHDVVYDACRNAERLGKPLQETLVEHSEIPPQMPAQQTAIALSPENDLGLCSRIVKDTAGLSATIGNEPDDLSHSSR